MRDRRNTNMSTSSTSSCASSVASSSPFQFSEKDRASPPPTTALPPPVMASCKDQKPKKLWLRALLVKALAALCIISVFYQLAAASLFCGRASTSPHYSQADLPHRPSALAVKDQSGASRWTVYTPPNTSFPLSTNNYDQICTQGQALRNSIAQSSSFYSLHDWSARTYARPHDTTFLDVADAERIGAIPAFQKPADDTCESSLTFVMDETDSSFGKTLLALWMSYGMAKKQGRAFFIDDSSWVYGKWASYFVPIPAQGCSPPPSHYILPCPHDARHLVVSTSSDLSILGHTLKGHSHPRRRDLSKNHHTFNLARKGFEDLFHLANTEDLHYATTRIKDLRSAAESHSASVVAIHIRRGDLHPFSFQFAGDYIPLDHYATAAHALRGKLDNVSAWPGPVHAPILVASDDPTMTKNQDLVQAAKPFAVWRAQERILLATKEALDRTAPVRSQGVPGTAYIKHIDENSGWEGGFYPGLFYAMGGQGHDAKQIREMVGRAYLMDLAVLSEGDGVVCAVSSAACRLLGVMLGWDAVKEGKWVNVDDGRVWSWDERR